MTAFLLKVKACINKVVYPCTSYMGDYPANIYLFKVSSKTLEKGGKYFTPFLSNVSIVKFEQVNVS